jgi:hypothetical protein
MTTEKNRNRVLKRLQLVSADFVEPDALRLEIDVQHSRAAVYCCGELTPEQLRQLVDSKADRIAEQLDAWGID